MKRLHFAFGIIGLLVFILTGQVRRLHQPAMRDLQPEYRMMFISRHIYILGTDLTNLMVAVYLRASASPWARRLQNVGSLLLLASLILLALAFFREPGGLLGRSWESAGGLYALLAGALFHALNLRPESPDP